MGLRRLLGLQEKRIEAAPTSIVIREGQSESISICHHDGSISEVRVSADNDDLNIHVNPAWHHSPHLTGGYL